MKVVLSLFIFSMLVLSIFIVGCGDEQAGEASRMLKKGPGSTINAREPADLNKAPQDAEDLQAVAPSGSAAQPDVSGQGDGIAIPQATGSPAQPSVAEGQDPGSLEGAQMVASHTVDDLVVDSNRFGNVVWTWNLPEDDGACVFPGQPGFRKLEIYIDGALQETVDCKSDHAQYTKKFSVGETHTIKIVTVTVSEDGTETSNSPGVSNTVVVA